MNKYFKIIFRVIKMSLLLEMTYGWNFLAGLIQVIGMILEIVLVLFLFYYSQDKLLGGYNIKEVMMVSLVSFLIITWFYFGINANMFALRKGIYTGSFDFILLKPGNSMALVFMQSFDVISGFVMTIFIMTICIWLLSASIIIIDFELLLLILFIFLSSIILISLLFFITTVVEFFWPRFFGFYTITNQLQEANKYPKQLFPQKMSFVLTYVWPIFFIANPIYLAMRHQYDQKYILIHIIVIMVFVVFSLLMWNKGLKKYQSSP